MRVLSRRVVYILDYSLCPFKFGYNTRRRNAPLGSRFHIHLFNHTELEIRKIHDQGRQPQMDEEWSMIQLPQKKIFIFTTQSSSYLVTFFFVALCMCHITHL